MRGFRLVVDVYAVLDYHPHLRPGKYDVKAPQVKFKRAQNTGGMGDGLRHEVLVNQYA
jgi:hypothetical protein